MGSSKPQLLWTMIKGLGGPFRTQPWRKTEWGEQLLQDREAQREKDQEEQWDVHENIMGLLRQQTKMLQTLVDL